jgi:hypothetical protein
MKGVNFIGFMLYITGYTYDYTENINEPPLTIRAAANSTYITRQVAIKKTGHVRKLLGYTYNVFIIIIMCWRVVYTIYMSIRDNDITPFGRSIFQMLFVLQYILGIMYFREKHFYQNISAKSDMTVLLRATAPFTILLSVVMAIVFTTLMINGINIHGYSDLYNNISGTGKIFLAILLFVDEIYSYQTFMINTSVFVINMIFHKRQVSSYAKSLNEEFIKSDQDVSSKVNEITIEYSLMKDSFDETVSVLNRFFSSLNFVGFLSIYFYVGSIKAKTITFDEIINFMMFIIVELVYIISIQRVNKSITKISDATGSTAMVAVYFTGNTEDDYHTLDMFRSKKGDFDMNGLKTYMHTNKSPKMYRKRSPKINTNKSPITEQDIITQSVDNSNMTDDVRINIKQSYKFDDINNNIRHDNSSDINALAMDQSYTNESLRNVMTTVSGIQGMINWIALQNITSAKWKTFSIFGVQLNDTTLISRLFGIAMTLLISTEVGSTLNWW